MSASIKKSKKKGMRRRRAHLRVRKRVRGTAERPRLAIFKSIRYSYAQLIDDAEGHTLVQANSRESSILEKESEGSAGNISAAKAVGELLAERAKALGIVKVVFDRGGFVYHGRVKAIADGARIKGLKF